VSVAVDNAREAVIKALHESGQNPGSLEKINASASALCAFQKACETEAVQLFAKHFCGEAHSHLACAIAQSIDTDDQLIVGHMRSAAAILNSGLSYARDAVNS
jgi:hypothetical protein